MITNGAGSVPGQFLNSSQLAARPRPIGQAGTAAGQSASQTKTYSPKELAFEQLLKERLAETEEKSSLQFSRHAAQRIQQRGIVMDTRKMEELSQAVEKARSKGAKDVVVIGRDEAYIVNVPNNTVITTVSGREMKENIFTNIDSAVIL